MTAPEFREKVQWSIKTWSEVWCFFSYGTFCINLDLDFLSPYIFSVSARCVWATVTGQCKALSDKKSWKNLVKCHCLFLWTSLLQTGMLKRVGVSFFCQRSALMIRPLRCRQASANRETHRRSNQFTYWPTNASNFFHRFFSGGLLPENRG